MARTKDEMLTMLSCMTDLSVETDSTVLDVYLDLAEDKIMRRLYPFGVTEEATLPSSLEVKVLEIAAYMINKRGAEGQVRHNENGVDRQYAAADVPHDMLRDVVPMAVPLGGGSNEAGE